MSLLGIDLGTSSLKTILIDDNGKVIAIASQEYGIDTPLPGWAEQDAGVWWEAARNTIGRVISEPGVNPADIKGIGLSGQMHGTVPLNDKGEALRPAVIWCDQRSDRQCAEIREKVGEEGLHQLCNQPCTGFMAPTLLWLKQKEPETFQRIDKVLLPKDYLKLKLTGGSSTDVSDASATLLFDVPKRKWADDVCASLDLPTEILPEVYGSSDVIGRVSREASCETGLTEGTAVVAGGADTPLAALANGVISPGSVLCSIGTGGLLLAPLDSPLVDAELRTNTFCHCLEDKWYIMGAILSGGLSLRWLRDNLLGGDYQTLTYEAEKAPPGSDGLVFLPHLIGERTPHMDPLARGAFVGLTLHHTRAHFARAVMEGVAFALRSCMEVFEGLGMVVNRVVASGGAASSPLWRQIQADIFGVELVTVASTEQAALGAALLAGMGVGLYRGAEDACERVVKTVSTTRPIESNARAYDQLYDVYKSLYPSLKEQFASLSRLGKQD